jgi:rRNA small subunit pseudouridine methyltransferase Nep1
MSLLAAAVACFLASLFFCGGGMLSLAQTNLIATGKVLLAPRLKLYLVIGEAALELVPESLRSDPSVKGDAKRRGIDPGSILLDRSIHHSAMLKLKDGFMRGRPDLIYLTLLSVTSTPLHQKGKVKVFIHTVDDVILEFEEETRPPKSYARFRNLMEKVLVERPEKGLVTSAKGSLPGLLKSIRPDETVGLSIQGAPVRLDALGKELAAEERPAVVVGGFPQGHFAPADLKAFDRLVRIDETSLDAHVVAARVAYEVERNQIQQG